MVSLRWDSFQVKTGYIVKIHEHQNNFRLGFRGSSVATVRVRVRVRFKIRFDDFVAVPASDHSAELPPGHS